MAHGDDARALGAGSYASVNGLNMYYEIHGTGDRADWLVAMIGEFLDAPMPEAE